MQISRQILQSQPIMGFIAPQPQTQATIDDKDTHTTSELDCLRSGPVQKKRNLWNCLDRSCSCSCHHTSTISRRFWAFEFSGLNTLTGKCDQPSCTGTSYGIRLVLAFSRFGIPWSSIISLQVATALGKVQLRPSLELQRTVRYTSPGFAAIWKLEKSLITFEEACTELERLSREDPSFRTHVNPAGVSYIEVGFICSRFRQQNSKHGSRLFFGLHGFQASGENNMHCLNFSFMNFK